jgi:O-antigen/teichoic acid export membrane protein
LAIARTVAFTFTVALPLLLVRRLSQYEFGIYKQVFLVINTAVTTLPLGFGMSAYYFLPRERERAGQVVLNVILFSAAIGGIACLLLCFYPTLLVFLFKDPTLRHYAPQIGVVVVLWLVGGFLEVLPVARGEARTAMIFIVCLQITRTMLIFAAAVFLGTVKSLLLAAILYGGVQDALLFLYVRSRFPGFWRRFDPHLLRRQLTYALPFGLAGLLYILQIDLHNYFVSRTFGAALFAMYAVGCFQLPLVSILGDSIGPVMISRVSLLQQQGEHREIIELTARAMRKLAFLYLPVFGLLLVVGREFIEFLFTERYLGSWPIFAVNLWMLPLGILMFDPIMRAFAEERHFLLKLYIPLCLSLFVVLALGTRRAGLVGTIAIVVIANAVARFATVWKAAKILGARWSDLRLLRDVGKLAAATLAAALAAALLRSSILWARPLVILLACGAIFSLTYAAGVLLLRIPTAGERQMAARMAMGILERLPGGAGMIRRRLDGTRGCAP